MPAAHDYFEHGADIGVEGRGATVEEAFVQAAQATFGIMSDGAAARPRQRVDVEFDEDDLELALVRWLNALLAQAREHGLALGCFELLRDGAHWRGSGYGEPWRRDQTRGTEVKGATLTALSVAHDDAGWLARCVVDV